MKASLKILVGIITFFTLADAHAMRWYSPNTGRWFSRDPIGEGGGTPEVRFVSSRKQNDPNLYAFVRNNPVNAFDILGLKPGLQCEINGAKIAFAFDGMTFSGSGLSVPAVSGLPISVVTTRSWQVVDPGGYSTTFWHSEDLTFDYSAARQRLRDVGPVPAGQYYIEQCEERSARTSPYSHIVKRSAWGDYSWSLHADAGTETYGRGGFFIHGGNSWGSKGCIDLKGGDSALHNLLSRVGNCGCCFIPITVGYSVQQYTVSQNVLDRTIGGPVGW